MYEKIKALADEAIALQNKNRMDEVLREISGLCVAEIAAFYVPEAEDGERFEAASLGADSKPADSPKRGRKAAK